MIPFLTLLRMLVFALAVAFAAAAAPPAATAATSPSFFNSQETPSKNMKAFKKWLQALKRYSAERANAKQGGCEAKEMNACNYRHWIAFLKKVKDLPKLQQLQAVNKRMNGAKYIKDQANWGRKDYWASPGEFMARFGDCEDYAIVKYLSLRLLGWPDKDLRVVAVKDMNLKVGHAVLVAFVDGKSYLLDNQIKTVVETTTVHHYKPVFSINTTYWWRHT
jgi:predicted transglutaminase-like cysteine proteinase